MTITTIVLVIAFSSIYFAAAESANHRHPAPNNSHIDYPEDVSLIIEDRITVERRESLTSLLFTLLATGFFVELAALIAAIYFSERAVQPVQDAYNAQKTFIANASHEIKTPLAAIQANLEAADIQGNHWLDNVASEVEDLAALNQQLLTLARIDGDLQTKKETTDVNLKSYLDQLISPFTPRLDQKKIKLTVNTDHLHHQKTPIIKADFKQIFGILFDNAIKYGKHAISITLKDHSIAITNDGTTISAEGLTHIFDRFYQTDKSKNGVGLGLAIAKQVADSNHWRLSATSDQKTTTFTLDF